MLQKMIMMMIMIMMITVCFGGPVFSSISVTSVGQPSFLEKTVIDIDDGGQFR